MHLYVCKSMTAKLKFVMLVLLESLFFYLSTRAEPSIWILFAQKIFYDFHTLFDANLFYVILITFPDLISTIENI